MTRRRPPQSGKTFLERLRRIFFLFRLACLFVLVGASYQLMRWSHNYDPRFYQFLGTGPGRALSSLMEWPNLYNRDTGHKPYQELNDEEKRWHDRIRARLQQSWPTHTLIFKNGKVKDVRILSTEPGYLNVREHLGTQGRLEIRIPLSELSEILPFADPLPGVSLRDVRFQMEYPDFDLTYFGHYTVLTDAPYYEVASSVETLEEMHSQYVEIFSPLIRFPRNQEKLQVLFFSNEKDYRAHQNNTAPDLSSSVGYYSPLEDRMVVFNQQFSDRANLVRKDVGDDIAELLKRATTASQRQQILQMQQRAESQIRDRAKTETMATLRHEGAHHLSYTYGVHSWIHTENAWLIEGLATYFETPTPGDSDPVYLETLFVLDMQKRIPSLSRLVEIRQPESFERELPGLEAHEAYALSWSLFHFCMLPDNRDAFFGYLQKLQTPRNIGKLMDVPRTRLLAESLGMNEPSLEKAWRSHLGRLMAGES